MHAHHARTRLSTMLTGAALLTDVLAYLRCPLCRGELSGDASLRCTNGHSYDVARQGYVNLLVGAAPAGADTAEMVTARAQLLAGGLFDGLTRAVTELIPPAPGLIIEVGAGTGHYLAAAVDRVGAPGLALDIAKAAVRRAAQSHPRVGAAVCDIWRGLPVADACAAVVLDVFAPRNPEEFHRVLRPDSALVVATPRPGHLAELVDRLGLLGMDPDKEERLDVSLAARFRLETRTVHREPLPVGRADALRIAAMGPSAFHIGATELAERVAALPDPFTVTLDVRLGRYRPR
jgi:23S rRNA (guanine745-N1)-methyltransferase